MYIYGHIFFTNIILKLEKQRIVIEAYSFTGLLFL